MREILGVVKVRLISFEAAKEQEAYAKPEYL